MLPVLTFAADTDITANEGLGGAMRSIVTFINGTLLPFIFAIAVFILIWGIFQFVTSGGDEEKRKKGRDTIVWGVIFLFVMLAVVGLVNLLDNTFAFDDTADIPKVPVGFSS